MFKEAYVHVKMYFPYIFIILSKTTLRLNLNNIKRDFMTDFVRPFVYRYCEIIRCYQDLNFPLESVLSKHTL